MLASISGRGSSANRTASRLAWVDVCKGLCICLVVFGHVAGGLAAGGVLAEGSPWLVARQWVYLFHMPAFFALSGFFAARLAELSAAGLIKNRLQTLAYPYVVWTAIIVGVQFAMARFVNNPVDFPRAARFWLEPYGYGLWFLYALFLMSLVDHGLNRLLRSRWLVLSAAILCAWLASRNLFGFWPILNTAMAFFIYYAAGAILPQALKPPGRKLPAWLAGCTGAALLGLMTALAWLPWKSSWLAGTVCALLGVAGAMLVAKGLAETFVAGFWAFLGVYSLEIYLGHPLWGTLSRAMLHALRVQAAAGYIAGGLILGIGGSLAVGVACRAAGFPWLFRWPGRKAAPAPAAATGAA